jgi:hypothetical protein
MIIHISAPHRRLRPEVLPEVRRSMQNPPIAEIARTAHITAVLI